MSWLRSTQSALSSSAQVGLLPFPMADALLPGESLEIHLSAASSLVLLETALRRDHGCIAQLVERAEGSVCATAPLLELRERRKHKTVGQWCRFVCVGAVRLSSIELRTAAERLDDADSTRCLVAQAQPLQDQRSVDYDSADDEEAFLASAVESAFAQVNELRRAALSLERATSSGLGLSRPPAADDRVEYGYRLGPVVGPYLELDGLVELRAESLCACGLDEPPAELRHFFELWGTADSESARRWMLSFAASEPLDAFSRMGTLAQPDTTARLEHTLRGLRQLCSRLATKVALERLEASDPDRDQ